MKPKLIGTILFLAALACPDSSARADGPRIFVEFQGGWSPSRFCPPIVYGGLPRLYACAPFVSSSWGYFPGFESPTYSTGFRNVSPAFNFHSGPTIIRVPAPVLTAPAVPVEPSAPFRWRR